MNVAENLPETAGRYGEQLDRLVDGEMAGLQAAVDLIDRVGRAAENIDDGGDEIVAEEG